MSCVLCGMCCDAVCVVVYGVVRCVAVWSGSVCYVLDALCCDAVCIVVSGVVRCGMVRFGLVWSGVAAP